MAGPHLLPHAGGYAVYVAEHGAYREQRGPEVQGGHEEGPAGGCLVVGQAGRRDTRGVLRHERQGQHQQAPQRHAEGPQAQDDLSIITQFGLDAFRSTFGGTLAQNKA